MDTLDSLGAAHVPTISRPFAKWYAESESMYVLFNTRCMSSNNPLLVLTPYASLCWRGIVDGLSISQIQEEALRTFGCDEVVPFLQRLVQLGFIGPLPIIPETAVSRETIVKELSPPQTQGSFAQSAIPWYCLWELCTVCDLRCGSCYLPHFTGSGPSAAESMQIVQQLEHAGVFYVCLLGGEPLLRKDLEPIIRRLRRTGIFVKVLSNGHRLSADRAIGLARSGLNQIEISFDGLSPDTHEVSRGSGSFARAIDAVRHAQDAGIPRVGIILTIRTDNLREIPNLPRFMQALEVKECYISSFKKVGMQGAASSFNPVRPNDEVQIRQLLDGWQEEFPALTISMPAGCSCGRTSIVISHNGDVRLCTFLYNSVGNVYRTPLNAIWRQIRSALPQAGSAGYCFQGTSAHELTTVDES